MTKSQLIKPENYFLIGVVEIMKANLKPDERIIWQREDGKGKHEYPMTVKKGTIRLWLDKMIEKVSTIGLRYKIKRRIK